MTNENLYDYGCRNLRFLLDIFRATGFTPQTFGLLTDNPHSTSTALRLQLNKDDMKISRAKQIVSTLGYELSIDNKEKKPPRPVDPRYKLVLPKTLQRNLERGYLSKKDRNKNLSFLLEFLSRNGITKSRLVQAVGLCPGAVLQWFHTDDMAISYLYKIEEAYDVDIIFIVSSKSEDEQER